MSDYAELVERLHDEARLPAQKDWDRHEAADAIKALVQERDRLLRDLEIMVRRADNEERAMERAERAEAIAKGWAEAADRARQPDVFYKDYNEGTMRAMQVLLSKASVKLAECMAHAKAMASAPNQELLNVDREAFRTWRAKQ